MTETGIRGPYAKGVRRRREILDRALEVFAERGSSGTSLRAIAAEIDIEHSTIRHYFDSLEALKLAVVARNEARTEALLADQGVTTLQQQMQRSAEANVGVRGLIALYTSMLATSVEPTDELSRDHFTDRFARARASIATSIEEGRRLGVTPPGPPAEALAALMIGAFDGLQVQWLLDPTVDLPGVLALLDPMIGDAPATPFSDVVDPDEAQPAD
jgi:TetR/AcrR family transcriptional regulator, transcriptional repressor of aconitase